MIKKSTFFSTAGHLTVLQLCIVTRLQALQFSDAPGQNLQKGWRRRSVALRTDELNKVILLMEMETAP